MDIFEVIIKVYQQILSQVDVFFGNDDFQCEGVQYEDDYGDSCIDEYGFWIVFGRIFYVFYMDIVYFYIGIEQEDVGSQYQVVEVVEIGEEVVVKVYLVLFVGSKVNYCQYYQQVGRNDCIYYIVYFGYFVYLVYVFQ